ncbi:hypothetical protein [Plebeiibacterium marinum]|uniref:Uncharacterized protein n=1 Tax=Plebeiibacterium marinum TaxID=2992111 RepID=A0AAE3MG98_9BACT|nr:hypothetical protein [Plebeiobacterium marinum]MCW3806926.1 hypothetical protein [Plebeiobacterium marinum]
MRSLLKQIKLRKKLLTKTTILLLLTTIIISFSAAWSIPDKDFLSKIIRYQKINRQEKLYLHVDKPIYVTGEDLWFSIFLNEVSTNLLNKTEQVVYAELISPTGSSTLKKLFKVENGRGSGHISLPNSLPTGNYLIMAYTNWMRNMGSDFYFKKEITIINDKEQSPTSEEVLKATASSDQNAKDNANPIKDNKPSHDISLQFFPEGGNIINGILCKIAFEGITQNGSPATFEGEIIDNTGKSVALIRPIWDGKGVFSFIPEPSKTYQAIINNTDTFNLPKTKENGYQLAVESSFRSDKILIRVQGSAQLANPNLFVLVMQGQKPMIAVADSLVNNQLLIPVDKSKLNTGIAQITVFDDKKIPQCERLVFINHYDFTTINIQPVNPNPAGREKMTLNISTLNQQGQPVPGTFSLAVTDASRIPDKFYQPMDFVSYNIFGSELPNFKGDASFVMKKSAKSAIQTDLVMLTNGWRRYAWEEVLKDSVSLPRFLEEPGIYLKGKVMKLSSEKMPDPGVQVFMRFKEKDRGDRYYTTTDQNSEFTFILNEFTDSLVAILTTKDHKKKFTDYSISLESNLASNAMDLKAKNQLSNHSFSETIDYQNHSAVIEINDLKKNQLAQELVRAKAKDFFVDTANVSIDEVKILGTKIRNVKDVMTSAYGAPSKSIGTKQLEDLSEELDWNSGLISVIATALPGLEITEILSDSLDYEYLRFSSRDRRQHRFFIYVDGKMVGATDDKGVLKNMLRLYEVNDLISLGADEVKSIDLIYPQQGTSKLKLNSESLENTSLENITSDESMTITSSNVSSNQPVQMQDPINDFKTNPLFYSSPEAILSIYTKTGGGLYSRSNTKGINKFYLSGYAKVKEFYSPDYSDDKAIVNQDKRSTLYWNPLVTTDETGTAQIEFYNSDVSGMFRVEAVGFSDYGNAGNTRIVFGEAQTSTPQLATTQQDVYPDEQVIANKNNENWLDKSKQKIQVLLKSNQPAGYAFVSVPSKNWTTLTDPNGFCYIDDAIIAPNDTICLNYNINESLCIIRSEITNPDNPIILQSGLKSDTQYSGEEVFKTALRNIIKTKAKNNDYANCIYRQQIFKGTELQHLLDLKTELRLPSCNDHSTAFTPEPVAGRIFRVENYDNNAAFTPYNNSAYKVPILDPFFTEITFLKSSYKKYYDFTYLGTCKYQNRDMYAVYFDQKDNCTWVLSSGYALIDMENYGIAYLNWKVSDKSLKYAVPDMYLMGGTTNNNFTLSTEENQAFYLYINGEWKFNTATQNVGFQLDNTSYSYKRELLTTGYHNKDTQRFQSTSLDKMKTRFILVKEPQYLPHLWRDGWLLPSNESIMKNIPYMHEIIFLSKP